MARIVSDEVWLRLDHRAGALPHRTVVRLVVAVVALTALLAGSSAVWASGIVVSRVVPAGGGGWGTDTATRTFRYDLVVKNDGWTSVTVLGAGRRGPGLELVSVGGRFPVTMEAGEEATFALDYRVADCTAVSPERWPIPLRVQRWWGEQTTYVAVPAQTSPDAPDHYSWVGVDPYGVEWQRLLADYACGLVN